MTQSNNKRKYLKVRFSEFSKDKNSNLELKIKTKKQR